jgi:hypothetical protein
MRGFTGVKRRDFIQIIYSLLGSTKTIRAVRSNFWLGIKAHHS